MTKTILVTGAAGQLGSAVVELFGGSNQVMPFTRASLDLTDHKAVSETIAAVRPDAIVNCASYNDVDGSEQNAVEALRVNALAVRAMARAASDIGATLVHYGTDFVFDGTASRPYSEDDEPAPQGVYASSKLLGEWFASDAPRHYVLRVESLFGGVRRRSSVDRIANAIRSGEPARVFVDRTVTPSYVRDVATATMELLRRTPEPGVYHCVNTGVTTWFELAQEIGRVLGIEPSLVPVKVADVPMQAKRPQYAALSNAKLTRAGISMPEWRDALRRYLS